jgi:alpha-beta hydrolase superfamily lysophospholipase
MLTLMSLVAALGLSMQQEPQPQQRAGMLTRSLLPETRFVTPSDGTKIAYDVTGSGPVVILLHGGGMTRRSWHSAGYVARLARECTVVTIDIRGNGESARPSDEAAFWYERMNEDILAVADAVKAPRFALWGFSYGANVGRYLASRSDRVSAMIIIGINFGAAVNETFMGVIKKMPAPEPWLTAMIKYPPVEPADMKCPTLWVVGSRNTNATNAFESAQAYRSKLAGTRVTLEVIDGLNHPDEFEQIDRVFAREIEFTRSHR